MAEILAKCRFPDPADGPVALAVSGGADSTALMVLARRAGLQGCVVHVDHGLRAGSAAEAERVAVVAEQLGFAFSGRTVRVPPGADLEARARAARYAVLPDGVLTGHTMDDQAETVLLNMLRGAAMDGLRGMAASPAPPTGPRRPLLGVRRDETVAVCRGVGIVPLDDPSNLDARFRRNRVRHELLPLMGLIAERDMVPLLARQAEIAAADAQLLDGLAAAVDPTDVRALRAAAAPLARRSLRQWLRTAGRPHGAEAHPPSLAELERVMDVVAGRARACQIGGGRTVARRAGRLRVEPPDAPDADLGAPVRESVVRHGVADAGPTEGSGWS